jgi:hypothetical protein
MIAIRGTINMADPSDLCACSYCDVTEHIHLLDGVITQAGFDTGKLACIRCYPEATRRALNPLGAWAPLSTDHFKLSVAPELKPLYDEWIATHPEG